MTKFTRLTACASLLFALVSFAALSTAQSPFDGTWRIDPGKIKFDPKPFTVYLSQGWYHCVSCQPPYDLQADGQFHPVAGQPTVQSITVVDPHTLFSVSKKDGKTLEEDTSTVSADGKEMVIKGTNYPVNGSAPQQFSVTLKRAGNLPSGVHATSGNWVAAKLTDSENDLLTTYKTVGDEISMSDPTGDSYTAKFDGHDYPYKGGYLNYTVSLKRINSRTFEETDKRDGKVVGISKITVLPDGKTMNIVSHDPRDDRTTTAIATKK